MDFRILGPLEAHDGDRELALGGGKQRALLALLLVNANRTVSIDGIVDALWGDDVPESAQKMVQIYVSKLRKVLPPGMLRTRPPGYGLELGPDELDLKQFESAVVDARTKLDGGEVQQAADRLRAALALWRGPALAEFAAEPFAQPEGARLEELRVAALELRLEADLALGRHGEVVSELEALTGRHPLRERLRSQHMLALYRSGRHAEALAAYQSFRRRLADELGMEPSVSLRDFERQILQQDPALELPVRATTAAATPTGLAIGHVAYARSGETRIAYQVVGDGPIDLVLVHGWVCTFQPGWEYPKLAAFYRRLASMGRLVLFDKRGTGLSDRVSPEHLPDLETRMDDVRAVLDSIGSQRAILLGLSEGGPMSVLFAATHPHRTAGLVLLGAFAREMQAPDYPWGVSEESLRRRLALLEEEDWASATTADWLGRVAPGVPDDPAALRWYTTYVQRGASPGAAKVLRLMNADIDVRDLLATISVPTLVLHRAGETWREGSRYLGEHIATARMVELPGDDHLPWEGDAERLLGEIERFVAAPRDEAEPDRVLATLLVADVAGPAPDDLVVRYERLVRTQLARFRGREADGAGDGLLATFDGPARAIRAASAIVAAARDVGLEAGVGVHAGEVEWTATGVRGIAVEVGTRIAAAARPGEVLVSSTVRDIVAGSGIAFEDRGTHELEGSPGSWRLFAAGA